MYCQYQNIWISIYNKGGDFLSKPEVKTSIEIFGCWTILDMI